MSELAKTQAAPRSEDEYDIDEKKRSAATSPNEEEGYAGEQERKVVPIPWIQRAPLLLAVLLFTRRSFFLWFSRALLVGTG